MKNLANVIAIMIVIFACGLMAGCGCGTTNELTPDEMADQTVPETVPPVSVQETPAVTEENILPEEVPSTVHEYESIEYHRDENGNLIDQDGNLIDENGNIIDENGNIIKDAADTAGNMMEDAGNAVDNVMEDAGRGIKRMAR